MVQPNGNGVRNLMWTLSAVQPIWLAILGFLVHSLMAANEKLDRLNDRFSAVEERARFIHTHPESVERINLGSDLTSSR